MLLVHPLTILSTLPSAGLGALLALRLTGTEFSLIALLGLFLLIGIVMKNAILMIDFAIATERKDGVAPREAIYQAALLRLRPIMMTNIAALLGALPLVLATGEGVEMRRPRSRHRGRIGGEPAIDPVFGAGRIPLARSYAECRDAPLEPIFSSYAGDFRRAAKWWKRGEGSRP